jgi:hypothetical protein
MYCIVYDTYTQECDYIDANIVVASASSYASAISSGNPVKLSRRVRSDASRNIRVSSGHWRVILRRSKQ